MTGRPAPATVGRGRVAISLVDGLPAGNEVAKGCSHVLDVAGLDIRAVGLDQKSTRSGELPGQGEVMKADPRLDAGVSSSEEHRSIMVDEGFVVHALLGFEPRPLDREAMMAQPEAGQNREISRALPANPLPSLDSGVCPVRSQSNQSEAGAAPCFGWTMRPFPT